MDETAAAPGSDNSSRIASAFANTDATSQFQNTNVAMQAGSNSTTSTATGDIKLTPSAKRKSKAPLIIIALLVLAGVGALVWGVTTGRLGSGETSDEVAEYVPLEEARKSFDQFATYVLFGESSDELNDVYNPNKEYKIETESYAEKYNAEFWDRAEQLLANATNSYYGVAAKEWGTENAFKILQTMMVTLKQDVAFTSSFNDSLFPQLESGQIELVKQVIASTYVEDSLAPESVTNFISERKKQYVAFADIYKIYEQAGCLTSGTVDDVCIDTLPEGQLQEIEALDNVSADAGMNASEGLDVLYRSFARQCFLIHNSLLSYMAGDSSNE